MHRVYQRFQSYKVVIIFCLNAYGLVKYIGNELNNPLRKKINVIYNSSLYV